MIYSTECPLVHVNMTVCFNIKNVFDKAPLTPSDKPFTFVQV